MIPDLRNLSLGERIVCTVVILLALLFAIALFGWLTGGWEDDPPPLLMRLMAAESKPELCMDDDTRERVRQLMYEGLDEALKEKIRSLFEVWLRDETGQPARASKGMQQALLAYQAARIQAGKFNPPECSG
jgi:hypothetical protein